MDGSVTFRAIAAGDGDAVVEMMRALYEEDASGYVSSEHFRRTVEFLTAHPERGRIVVFDAEGEARIGYAICIPYWSNEFGGSVVEVDELFVRREYRSRGIGRAFFEWVESSRLFEAVAIELEVTPGNARAQEFYRRMGFAARRNVLQVKRVG